MIIDGKEIANHILQGLKLQVARLREKNVIPHLVIILINNNPASVAYVNQKKIKGKSIGANIAVKHISKDISQSQLLKTIEQFNNDNNVHGIIVQRPLPKHIDEEIISQAIDPKKDVDGFHPNSYFQSPIAKAVLRVLNKIYSSSERSESRSSRFANAHSNNNIFTEWLKSQQIVIIGKGATGGKPVTDMLKKMNITPSIIDSKTPNPKTITKKADIIISAVGKANIVKPEMIKKGVILIGVGLHKEEDGKLHGDYDEEKIKNIVSFYAPTPGGVGPVNVAMLLKNLIQDVKN